MLTVVEKNNNDITNDNTGRKRHDKKGILTKKSLFINMIFKVH